MDFKKWFEKRPLEFKILFVIWCPIVIFLLSVFLLSLGKPLGLYDLFNS